MPRWLSAGCCTCARKTPSSHGNLLHQNTGQPPRNPGSSPPPTIPAPQHYSIPTSAGKTATASNTAGPAEATNPTNHTSPETTITRLVSGLFQHPKSGIYTHILGLTPRMETQRPPSFLEGLFLLSCGGRI